MLPELDDFLEVLEYLSCMKLFDFGVVPDPGLDDSFLLEHRETLLDDPRSSLSCFVLLDLDYFQAPEEDLDNLVKVVDEHLLKEVFVVVALSLIERLIPHFKNNHFSDIPVLAPVHKVLEGLGLFLLVLADPVAARISLLYHEFLFDRRVNLFLDKWIST